ncbi:unnamed protein product [Oncorhynchus mykiss]|uniref:RRM domain-containing protein n=1 Tax=Oncorhynchus mykiss TaxID=8022 RepID=A0A060YFF1_ONCMY|nr:unnamed protein product [Oncorhynchus mykiss]
MAAASSIQPPIVHSLNHANAPFLESDSPETRQDEDAVSEGTSLRDLPDLEPDEIEKRLEKTRHELSNRRKILIKNLPQDTTNQEVHEILREYELKYCFVDRNKGTGKPKPPPTSPNHHHPLQFTEQPHHVCPVTFPGESS